jgi:hypothetical protein
MKSTTKNSKEDSGSECVATHDEEINGNNHKHSQPALRKEIRKELNERERKRKIEE